MKRFLKLFFKFNIFLSLFLMTYSLVAFLASALGISFLFEVIADIQLYTSFNLLQPISEPLYLALVSFFGFFINQYFYKVYVTLFNFDKFMEITGLFVIPLFAIGQFVINALFIGIIAMIPLLLSILSAVLLKIYQNNNGIASFATQFAQANPSNDPMIREMGFKIGQLRMLKSAGKITDEEFMLHLNNILENKE